MVAAANDAIVRVLIVADSLDYANILATLLSSIGCRVYVATNPEAACLIAQSFRPQLGLIVFAVPPYDVAAAANRLRNRQELRRTMLVAVTGCEGDKYRILAIGGGFDQAVVKSNSMAVLTELIDRLRYGICAPS